MASRRLENSAHFHTQKDLIFIGIQRYFMKANWMYQVPWKEYSEEEIQEILAFLFRGEGYDVYNAHKTDVEKLQLTLNAQDQPKPTGS
jgi:NADH dehydrogenase FAD-containing subunit